MQNKAREYPLELNETQTLSVNGRTYEIQTVTVKDQKYDQTYYVLRPEGKGLTFLEAIDTARSMGMRMLTKEEAKEIVMKDELNSVFSSSLKPGEWAYVLLLDLELIKKSLEACLAYLECGLVVDFKKPDDVAPVAILKPVERAAAPKEDLGQLARQEPSVTEDADGQRKFAELFDRIRSGNIKTHRR
jgi:hypothetical protein